MESSSNKLPKSEEKSQELQKLIAAMTCEEPSHRYVYPPKPTKDVLLIPIGGLAKCQCSPTCEKELTEPAYREATAHEIRTMIEEEGPDSMRLKVECKVTGKKVNKKKNALKLSVVKKGHS